MQSRNERHSTFSAKHLPILLQLTTPITSRPLLLPITGNCEQLLCIINVTACVNVSLIVTVIRLEVAAFN